MEDQVMLRDYFAGLAMQGFLAHGEVMAPGEIEPSERYADGTLVRDEAEKEFSRQIKDAARCAYRIADAMIFERKHAPMVDLAAVCNNEARPARKRRPREQ